MSLIKYLAAGKNSSTLIPRHDINFSPSVVIPSLQISECDAASSFTSAAHIRHNCRKSASLPNSISISNGIEKQLRCIFALKVHTVIWKYKYFGNCGEQCLYVACRPITKQAYFVWQFNIRFFFVFGYINVKFSCGVSHLWHSGAASVSSKREMLKWFLIDHIFMKTH